MSVVTVCKNVIASNNKRKWIDPDPSIRIANTKSGKVIDRKDVVNIVDKDGEVVATLESSTDGKPLVKCGAKVALFTKYKVQ